MSQSRVESSVDIEVIPGAFQVVTKRIVTMGDLSVPINCAAFEVSAETQHVLYRVAWEGNSFWLAAQNIVRAEADLTQETEIVRAMLASLFSVQEQILVMREVGDDLDQVVGMDQLFQQLAYNGLIDLKPDVHENQRIVQALRSFPLPIFGSPPDHFVQAARLIGSHSGITVAAYGLSAATGEPLLTLLAPAGIFLFWFGKPFARMTRRTLAEKAARVLKTDLLPEDLG